MARRSTCLHLHLCSIIATQINVSRSVSTADAGDGPHCAQHVSSYTPMPDSHSTHAARLFQLCLSATLVAAVQKPRRLTALCTVASHVSSANAAQLTGSEAVPGAASSRPAAARSTWQLLHSRWWDERGRRGAGGGGRCRAPLAMSSRRRTAVTAGAGQCQPWRQAQRRGRVWLHLLLDLVQPLTGAWAVGRDKPSST